MLRYIRSRSKGNEITLVSPPFTLSNAPSRMYIPVTTHIGATESYRHVHPDILQFRSLLPNGFKNILSLTPYTNQDDAYENPSLAFSKNLENWDENEVSNPLHTPRSGYHNSDSCLCYDPIQDRFLIYWLEGSEAVGKSYIHLKISKDCVNWGSTKTIGEFRWQVSPDVFFDLDDNKFYQFICTRISDAESGGRLELWESEDGENFNYVHDSHYTQYYGGTQYKIWHMAVKKVGKEYWFLGAMNPMGSAGWADPLHIFFMRSKDKKNFESYDSPVLSPSAAGWDNGKVYRPTFFVKNQRLEVIYSGRDMGTTWGFGYTSADVSYLVDPDVLSSNIILERAARA